MQKMRLLNKVNATKSLVTKTEKRNCKIKKKQNELKNKELQSLTGKKWW